MNKLIFLLCLTFLPLSAQTTQQNQPPQPSQSAPSPPEAPPQEQSTPAPPYNPQATAAERADAAWSMLTDALHDAKHADLRVQALAALGTMGSNPRSTKLIVDAMSDPDFDVRTASVLAAGQTKDRNLTTNLHSMLDDKEPQVAFAAASTLWKMHDPSGEPVLIAVVNGERSASDNPVKGGMHSAHKELHHPSSLARLGALQGASALLGPFGFGITAFEYMHKKGGGNLARVSAIEQLSESDTGPIRNTLIEALTDKDPAVRAAAAKAVGHYHEPAAADALYAAFDDDKAPVRLTAAAAYLNSTVHRSTSRTSRTRLK